MSLASVNSTSLASMASVKLGNYTHIGHLTGEYKMVLANAKSKLLVSLASVNFSLCAPLYQHLLHLASLSYAFDLILSSLIFHDKLLMLYPD